MRKMSKDELKQKLLFYEPETILVEGFKCCLGAVLDCYNNHMYFFVRKNSEEENFDNIIEAIDYYWEVENVH